MNLFDIVRPEIAPACQRIFSLLSSGQLKISPQEVELFRTRILFKGNPIPKVTVNAEAAVLTWADGATIDVDRMPKRMDPSVRRVLIYADKIVVSTGYGSVTLRS